MAYLDGLIDALRDDLLLDDGGELLDGYDGGKGLRLAPPKLLAPPLMSSKQLDGAVEPAEPLVSDLDDQPSSSLLTPPADVTSGLGSIETIVAISLSGAALSPIAVARLTAIHGGGVRVPAPLLLDVTPPLEAAAEAAEALDTLAAAEEADRAAEAARAEAAAKELRPKRWWRPRKQKVKEAAEAAKETEEAAKEPPEASKRLLAVEAEPEIAAKPITAVNRRVDAELWREAGSAALIALISLPGAALCPIASARLSADRSGRGGGVRVPPPSLIDVTPALEAAAEVQGHDSSTPELPAHEAEADIPPRPIVNDKLFDTEAWREAGCAELLASISLPGAALCPIASSRLSTDSSGRGGGLRVPPPSLLDVTPHVDETDVSACKATPSSAEEPLSVYEEIQMAAELAETIADAYSGKQLSLSSLLRATSGVDMLMTLNLPEMQLLSTSTARDALAEMHDKMSYPIAVARLSSDGNGRGGGLRVAPPSLVDFTTDEEAAVELTSSGTDAALVFRSKTIALQPGSSLPLRLGIYPRTASAPVKSTSFNYYQK